MEGRTRLFLVCMDGMGREGQGKRDSWREGMKETGAGLTHLRRSHTATSPASGWLRWGRVGCVGRADKTRKPPFKAKGLC